MFFSHYSQLASFAEEKMAKHNLFESHRFFADLYGLEPGQEQTIHTHENEEKLYFVLEGIVDVSIGDTVQALRSGESAVALAGEPHGLKNSGEGRAIVLTIMAPHPTLSQQGPE